MITHCGTRPIETERLELRRFRFSDAGDNWAGNPNVQFLYAEPVYSTKEEAIGLLERYISAYDHPDSYRWAVIEKSGRMCIGQIAFFLVQTARHFAEMEHCIGTAFHRRGYATEAAKAVIDYGFLHTGLHRVQLAHREGNEASKGVTRNCGCSYEGTFRDHLFLNGVHLDRMYYSILREEWKTMRRES